MRVMAEIRGFDVAGDIRFHGSHSEDEEVVNKIKELNEFLFDIFEQLEVVENQVEGRQEVSAIRIEREIKLTKKSLLETFFIEEDNQWH